MSDPQEPLERRATRVFKALIKALSDDADTPTQSLRSQMYDPVILLDMTYESIEDKDAYFSWLFRSIQLECMGRLPLLSDLESQVAWFLSEHDEGVDPS